MARDVFDRLVEDVHALPGAPDGEQPPFSPRGADRRQPPPARRHAIPPHELRVRVRELLAELARRVDASLPQTLAQAHGAWDQIDALRLIDKAVTDEQLALERAARLLQADELAELRALGTEAQLTLEAALGLASLVERRLATLVRLRLRAAADRAVHGDRPDLDLDLPAALLPEGRPFLDLGAALHETARRWT